MLSMSNIEVLRALRKDFETNKLENILQLIGKEYEIDLSLKERISSEDPLMPPKNLIVNILSPDRSTVLHSLVCVLDPIKSTNINNLAKRLETWYLTYGIVSNSLHSGSVSTPLHDDLLQATPAIMVHQYQTMDLKNAHEYKSSFMNEIEFELARRGNFKINIPKLVDKLFLLDVIDSADDFQNPMKEPKDEDNY